MCAYVDSGKEVGWPVERSIIYVKRLAELDTRADALTDSVKRAEVQRAVERAITWCVQHYYWAG